MIFAVEADDADDLEGLRTAGGQGSFNTSFVVSRLWRKGR